MHRANLTSSAHLGILMKSADELTMGALLRLPLTRVTTVKIGIRLGELLRFRRPCATVLASLLFLIPSLAGAESIARHWNDELLDAIRGDFARPTVHARNLFHVSVAMWDAWAAYDRYANTYLHHEKALQVGRGRPRPPAPLPGVDTLRAETISYAAYRILSARFANSPGAAESLVSFDAKMDEFGYDRQFTSTAGDSPAALGNRIARTVLEFGATDNSNEAGGYANLYYTPLNPPLVPALPGNFTILDPNRWQPLALEFFIDQAGNLLLEGFPEFLGPEWGQVRAFSLKPEDLTIHQRGNFEYWVFHDPGPPPLLGTPSEEYCKWGVEMVALWSSHLDPDVGPMIDISPGSIGNSPLPAPGDYEAYYNFERGGDSGLGHPVNPVTGEPYARQIVPLGDYARVLAEFWADGPDSETPPGHWFTIANYVSDHPLTQKRFGGKGRLLDDLEWDVKVYFALGRAMHDVAVAAWGAKGWYDYVRPISAIRYMAGLGQSSDPGGLSYHPGGLRLYPGKIEVVTVETSAPGERHEDLRGNRGKIALHAWKGPDYIEDPEADVAGVGWILAEDWWPYQRPSFVTPPFAGYVSGHSTFSRAAAELLTLLTGSEFFPGGLGEFFCPKQEFLVFEDGPSVDIMLQWATYQDASDQTSLSRIWGGIHPPADDLPGRVMGARIGKDAFALAERYFRRAHRLPARSRSGIRDPGN